MFAKLVALILVLMLLAVSLLVFRQQRLELAHDAVRQHEAVQKSRHEIWDAQTVLAERLRPTDLRPRLEQSPLALDQATEPPIRTRTRFADGRRTDDDPADADQPAPFRIP